MLLMKKVYFEAIRSGTKTTTLRYWRRAMVRAGSVHHVPGLGKVEILSVAAVSAGDLQDADARADGFADATSLHRELGRLYPLGAREGKELYLVRFRLHRLPS